MADAIVQAVTVPENKLTLLRETYAKGSTPQEFELFVAVCNRLRLDPFARQIYAVKRYDSALKREVMQAQVSIDGMRLTAERTGQYAGQAAPQWCGPDGRWVDVWLSEEPPSAARVSVYRRDFSQPMTAVALFGEYAQYKSGGELTRFWQVMPANQLAKCAEALALRKAFPNELSGVYSVDEMAQAENEPAPVKPQPPVNDNAVPKQLATQGPPLNVPRFHASWNNADWAGKPLADAPHNILAEYLEALDRVLADSRRRKLHPELKLARSAAEAAYDRLVVKQLDAAQEQADPIVDGLEAEYDRTRDEPQLALDGDGNDAWGLR